MKQSFQEPLLQWYIGHKRDLPWRRDPSVYKTVVSEFMLQQTRVETVLPYFANWLNQFSDFQALAVAAEEDVVKAWEGLGYYSRARNLRKLAIKILEMGGHFPDNPRDWERLPGIGPYTAAAVTSISFNYPAAVVDGNVVRVLARVCDVDLEFKDGGSAVKHFTPIANEFLDKKNPGDYNQAIMELGATVCHRQKPLCIICPIQKKCMAFKNKTQDLRPNLSAKKVVMRSVNRLIVLSGNKILLHKYAAEKKRLAGMVEIPDVAEFLDIEINSCVLVASKNRAISNEKITESFYFSPSASRQIKSFGGTDLYWQYVDRLDEVTLSGPHKKWIRGLIDQCKKLSAHPE